MTPARGPFDLDRLRDNPFLAGVEYRDSIDSTNDWARRFLTSGSQTRHSAFPRLFLTRSQTAGRGRGSRSWWSDEGCLTLTWVAQMESKEIGPSPSLLPLAAAVATWNAVNELVLSDRDIGPSLKIKWPNDIYLSGRKMAGILVETVTVAAQPFVLIGIGCNINSRFDQAPDEVRGRATSLLDQTGVAFDLTHATERLVEELAKTLSQVARQPDSIIEVCRTHGLWPRGTRLKIATTSGHPVAGTYLGLGPSGELQVNVGPTADQARPGIPTESSEVQTLQTFTSVANVEEDFD